MRQIKENKYIRNIWTKLGCIPLHQKQIHPYITFGGILEVFYFNTVIVMTSGCDRLGRSDKPFRQKTHQPQKTTRQPPHKNNSWVHQQNNFYTLLLQRLFDRFWYHNFGINDPICLAHMFGIWLETEPPTVYRSFTSGHAS